jgi:hypothetical protein
LIPYVTPQRSPEDKHYIQYEKTTFYVLMTRTLERLLYTKLYTLTKSDECILLMIGDIILVRIHIRVFP